MFNEDYGMRTNVKKVMVMYTSGKDTSDPNDGMTTESYMEKIKKKGRFCFCALTVVVFAALLHVLLYDFSCRKCPIYNSHVLWYLTNDWIASGPQRWIFILHTKGTKRATYPTVSNVSLHRTEYMFEPLPNYTHVFKKKCFSPYNFIFCYYFMFYFKM